MEIHVTPPQSPEPKNKTSKGKPGSFHEHIFKPPEESPSLQNRAIEPIQSLTTTYSIYNAFHSLAKGLEAIEKEFLHVGLEYEETTGDKMLAALEDWASAAPSGENRLEAKKKIEECLSETSSTLDLRGLKLTSLPDIWDYPVFVEKMESLDLSDNTLSALPDSLNSLETLKELILFNSGITGIPSNISKLQEIIKLQPTDPIDQAAQGAALEALKEPSSPIVPLHKIKQDVIRAINNNSSTEVEELLRHKGLNINDEIDGMTLLMRAASLGHKDIVKVLLDNGANLYAQDKSGMTAIRLAAAKGKENVVTFLERVMKDDLASSSFLLQHRLEHRTIINLLKPLYGNKVSEEGICHGFAVMGIQAILSGHLEQFNKRIEDLAVFLQQHKISEKGNKDSDYKSVIAKLQEANNLDLLAFLEGIQVCMSGGEDYPHLFSESPKQITTQQNTNFIGPSGIFMGKALILRNESR